MQRGQRFRMLTYEYGNYLSPFYSPLLWGDSHHSWFGGTKPGFWPAWLPFSPALLILPFPAGFRVTCYYYRGAYYKAFWADPPSCAVGEPRKGYLGENSLPLILQNIHRYFLYFALLFLCFLRYDAFCGFFFDDDGDGNFTNFGLGVGTLVLVPERVFAGRLHVGLPLVAAFGRRANTIYFRARRREPNVTTASVVSIANT